MLKDSYKVEGSGFNIYYDTNKKIRDTTINEFSEISKAIINPSGKNVYKKNITASADDVINSFFSRPAIGQYLKEEIGKFISTLSPNKMIEVDNNASYVNRYMWLTLLGNGKSSDISYVCSSLNTGYCLNLQYIRNIAAKENIDIEKELECLLADVKSYWALKITNDKKDALLKLEKNIIERENKIDLVRQKYFTDFSFKMATSKGFKKALGCVKILDESMKNIVYTKDKWTLFFVYIESFSFTNNGEPDYYASCFLRSLSERSEQDITGGTYPLKMYICFRLNKGLFGYKFIRPDGRTF